ncbi:MAG: lysophospholipid acyltransferase family protein [Cellvibrionaceae bacterium]
MSEQTTAEEPIVASPSLGLSSPTKSVLSILTFLVWIVLMFPVLFFYKLFNKKNIHHFYLLFHKGACRIFALRCHIEGKPASQKPVLFLSNHVSYLDVVVLGSCTPAYFIAKSEVANWPLFGLLAKLQNTLFFERKGNQVRAQMNVMSQHFDQKNNLILFAEGTSTNGEEVKPFKSSLLQSVENTNEEVLIQPVTVSYTHYKNKLMDKPVRDHFAWYDTMPFAPHFFSAAGMAKADVSVIFHQPVSLNDFATRKDCAQSCQAQVAAGLKRSLSS